MTLASIEEPPYLTVGTDVSAKYKGAFCEAKITDVNKHVKLRVLFDGGSGTHLIDDTDLKAGSIIETGTKIEAKHPEKKQQTYVQATITKVLDHSRYTVVFDDGDQCVLRRNSICLKSGKHFAESETLDQLPLTNPEHFGNPVKVGAAETQANNSLGTPSISSTNNKSQVNNHHQLDEKPSAKSKTSSNAACDNSRSNAVASGETSIVRKRQLQYHDSGNEASARKLKKGRITSQQQANSTTTAATTTSAPATVSTTASSTPGRRGGLKGRKRRESSNNGPKQTDQDDNSVEDSADSADANLSESNVKFETIEIGVKLMVQYGKGKAQNVYEAKVNKIETNSAGKTRYFVHYTGWNNRYDEWITKNRILSIVTEKEAGIAAAPNEQIATTSTPGRRGGMKGRKRRESLNNGQKQVDQDDASVEDSPESVDTNVESTIKLEPNDIGMKSTPQEAKGRAQNVHETKANKIETNPRSRVMSTAAEKETVIREDPPLATEKGIASPPVPTLTIASNNTPSNSSRSKKASTTSPPSYNHKERRRDTTTTTVATISTTNTSVTTNHTSTTTANAINDNNIITKLITTTTTGNSTITTTNTSVITNSNKPNVTTTTKSNTTTTKSNATTKPNTVNTLTNATISSSSPSISLTAKDTSTINQNSISTKPTTTITTSTATTTATTTITTAATTTTTTGNCTSNINSSSNNNNNNSNNSNNNSSNKPLTLTPIINAVNTITSASSNSSTTNTSTSNTGTTKSRSGSSSSTNSVITSEASGGDRSIAPLTNATTAQERTSDAATTSGSTASTSSTRSSTSGRQTYRFCEEIDESDCDKKISILQERIMALRQAYVSLRSELADLDRKKKRPRTDNSSPDHVNSSCALTCRN